MLMYDIIRHWMKRRSILKTYQLAVNFSCRNLLSMITTNDRRALITAALQARMQAHAPYSKFQVGAAILTASGKIISGCNVENSSYGLTICAERTAICTAVAAGEKDFAAIAVATLGGHPPCGACRQVMAEFVSELPILLVDADDPTKIQEISLRVLLPGRFELPK